MILFFDTETTGLDPGRIIQLSYIMVSEDEVKAKNFFFGVDYIEPSAAAVHGFTVEKLRDLSNGHTFSFDCEEVYDDFLSADLVVAHNFAFDLKFMMAEFGYMDRIFRYNESLCSMKYFTPILKMPRKSGRGYKYPTLGQFAEYYGVYPYDVTRCSRDLFGDLGHSHDARYDTCALYLSVMAAAADEPSVMEILNKYVKNTKREE